MISANEAYSTLQQALSGVRRDEDRLSAMLRSAEEDAARLRERQAEGFRALARMRLDAIARDEVVGQLESAEQRAKQVLAERRIALARATAEREKLEDQVEAAEAERAARAKALDAALEPVEALTEATEARMPSIPAWVDQVERLKAAEATAAAAEDKAKQAEGDRDQKGKPYEADNLFIYLWKRGYGTSAYQAGTIARTFDGMVARLIEYDAARPNYYMLTEIPRRLREHATRLREDVEGEIDRREEIERKALEDAGIVPLEKAVDAAEDAVEVADGKLKALQTKLAELDKQQAPLLDERQDAALTGAVEELATALRREDLNTLYRRAQETPTPEDEKIVTALRDVEGALVRKAAEAEEVRKTVVDMARRRSELERSESSFRTSGYNHPLGQFMNNVVIAQIIAGMIRGNASARDLEDAYRNGYSRRPGNDSFGGGIRLPRSGQWGGGGSWGGGGGGGRSGGGGFRTGGRMGGGGGFRTGGRF